MEIYFGCFTHDDSTWFFETSPYPTNSPDCSKEIEKSLKLYLLELLYECKVWNYGFNISDGDPCENRHTIDLGGYSYPIEIMSYISKTLLKNGCLYSDKLLDLVEQRQKQDDLIINYNKV